MGGYTYCWFKSWFHSTNGLSVILTWYVIRYGKVIHSQYFFTHNWTAEAGFPPVHYIRVLDQLSWCDPLFTFAVQVPTYKKGKKRDYRKDAFCLYCERLFTSKIAPHYLRMHVDKPLVQQIMKEKSQSKREDLLYKLQQLGNYKHNTKVCKQPGTSCAGATQILRFH